MNTLTLTLIFCKTLEIHFVKSHQESNVDNEFNDKVNYESGQLSAMEDKNFDRNEKYDDQELVAFQDQSVGSNEKLKLKKSEFSEERNDRDKLNYFNLDSTNEDRDVTEPRTHVKKESESNEKQDETNSQNRDVKFNDKIYITQLDEATDDANNVDKGQALDSEVSLAEEKDAENREMVQALDGEVSLAEEIHVENREMDEEMEKEREAGDAADLFGTNQHYNIPVNYQDFGRRFVLSYPYIEKNILSDVAESHLDNTVKQYLQSKKQSTKQITPMKAPPEFVLEIAKQSALLEASKPKNPADEIVKKNILRTGNYWNGVWKEEVDVDTILRTNNENRNQLESISVNILPGSKLYQLISMLKHKSPRFLYVINKSYKIYVVRVHLFIIFYFALY